MAALMLALALALAIASAAAPSAHAASGYYCPASGTVNLGAGNGCTGPYAATLWRVSFLQDPPVGTRCAVGKVSSDPNSSPIIAAVCGAGTGAYGEVYATSSIGLAGYPRGRNDMGTMQYNYFGVYYW